ncbi:MAG: aldehyde ferredoxin oxidoreductase family protein [Clostridia bacterium]|nr:aldehyde ferredoxin oxidoreductase family protein [Clostridia bacterium]
MNEVPGGYSGKILRINLSDKTTAAETRDEKFYRKYLGGSGIISYYLLKELQAGIDPLGPENKLIFALGPLTGTAIIGNGRNAVGAKSPMTGGIGLSQAGDYFGAELKHAGFDAIIVEGKAEAPVYISIQDEAVSIKDARHLWGLNTKETQEAIRLELADDKTRLALIGPGGENLVPYACIMHGLHSTAGRGGMGAVMGSKNLKAIAVRGHKRPEVADPEGVKAISKRLSDKQSDFWLYKILREFGTGGPELKAFELSGNLPVRNWRDGLFPGVENIHGGVMKETMSVGMDGCFACPMRCKKKLKFEEPYSHDPAYGGPEYETISSLGSNCGIDDVKAVVKGNELCNAYSLDTISTGCTIAFAMECFEKGLLSLEDTDGMELRFGNGEAMLKCIELIARKEGFGKLLAEGSARLAKRIGKGAEEFAVHVKGLEPGQHDPRFSHSRGIGYMVNPHGADHCMNASDEQFKTEGAMAVLKPLGFYEPVPPEDQGPRKVAVFKVEYLRQVLTDCLLVCRLATLDLDYMTIADITGKVTGWNTTEMELMRTAERIVTMTRLFNIREGFTADDDKLPKRFYQPKTDGALVDGGLDPEEMERAKKYFYVLMGWDEKGVPLSEKVEELYIDA